MKRAKYLVTKHYGEGYVHHVGRPFDSRKDAEDAAKRLRFKGGFRAKAVLRIWKMEKEIVI